MTATPVAPLAASSVALCPRCTHPATWAVGPVERSCTPCLGVTLADLYRSDPHPFHPHLPTPLPRGKW